jgi:2-keto-3-deoxy-galactonokinase
MTKTPAWIAVDWGTSRLRAWAMASDGVALEERASDDGMGRLAPDDFEAALLTVIGDWLGQGPINIVACGMVGARQGWHEAAYLTVPSRPHGGAFTRPLTQDERLNVHILPGMMQLAPADVMRGEETQIAGYLSLHSDFDGILCLPGTHTKWVHISAGEVVSFQTFMTGEIFALLCEKSVLRHSVQSQEVDRRRWHYRSGAAGSALVFAARRGSAAWSGCNQRQIAPVWSVNGRRIGRGTTLLAGAGGNPDWRSETDVTIRQRACIAGGCCQTICR